MYKSILVPVDLEHPEVGEASLRAAGALADAGATLTVLHVIPEIPGYAATYLPEDILRHRREEAQASVDKIVSAVGLEAATMVRTAGRPSTAILEVAESIKSDCIVIASHHPGVEDYFLGSTASRVVRHADCSVLVRR